MSADVRPRSRDRRLTLGGDGFATGATNSHSIENKSALNRCCAFRVPTFVRFEMNVPSGDFPPMVVAVWSDGQWNVFEGDQGADPRHLLAITLAFGTMTFGPRGSDWLLLRDLLINLTQSAVVHYR